MVLYCVPFNPSVFSNPWVLAFPRLDLSRLLKRYIMARTGRMRKSNFRVRARSAAGLMVVRVLPSAVVTTGSPLSLISMALPSSVLRIFSSLMGESWDRLSYSMGAFWPQYCWESPSASVSRYDAEIGGRTKSRYLIRRRIMPRRSAKIFIMQGCVRPYRSMCDTVRWRFVELMMSTERVRIH